MRPSAAKEAVPHRGFTQKKYRQAGKSHGIDSAGVFSHEISHYLLGL